MGFRLLRFEFKNITVFDDIVIDITASDRVVNKADVSPVYGPVYSQNVVALAGINATGKTTILRLIDMVMLIICDYKSLDQIGTVVELFHDDSEMIVDFFNDDSFCRLHSFFRRDEKGRLCYSEEMIYRKARSSVHTKQGCFEFSSSDCLVSRSGLLSGVSQSFIREDDSIVMGFAKNISWLHLDTLDMTNRNFILSNGPIDPVYLSLLDKSIESISRRSSDIEISFKHGERKVVPSIYADDYISSGTIRGSFLLENAARVLSSGGYLLIDEIENHLNKRLVQLLIGLFQDLETNPHGAVLIFSTHYSELIDSVNRKDNIYVLRKDPDNRNSVIRYSDTVKRNDIKKSDILLSNFIEGTAPSYEDIQAVREYLSRRSREI